MAYKNFIPTVWAAGIKRELEKMLVFAEDCNREFEGEVKKLGDQVKILGIGKPTVRHLSRGKPTVDIVSPEEIEDASVNMTINQLAYFNYMISDIDAKQAAGNIEDCLSKESTEVIADDIDQYIANLAKDDSAVKLYDSPLTLITGTASAGQKNVLDAIDDGLQRLRENKVKPNTKVVVTVSPRFLKYFEKEYRTIDTNNSNYLKNGFITRYNGVTVKLSSNVSTTTTSVANDTDLIQIKTQRAIAYADPFTGVEAYRPENKIFTDAVKGGTLYDAKIVRPKEMFIINVKYA